MHILRKSTALVLATASMLLIVLGVGSASAASGTAVSFQWTMHTPPDSNIRVSYRGGLVQILSSDLIAHRGAISRATFGGLNFVIRSGPSITAHRFAGTLDQKLEVDRSELTGVVVVPASSTDVRSAVILKNLETGQHIEWGEGTHHFSIRTGVSARRVRRLSGVRR
jgi:hypothetical protein